jgi:tetratricopeptide (TPR) repeat protein
LRKDLVLPSKQHTRRQLVEDARQAALNSQWEQAVTLNEQLLERFQKDAEAFNRLGHAKLALAKLEEAKDAYSKALRADPANLIARRNLQRLESLRGQTVRGNIEFSAPGPLPRTSVFLEEVGRTWVDELVNPSEMQVLADVYPGDQLKLSDDGGRLVVSRLNGQRLGEVEPKTGRRVIDLMAGGNRYEVYALGLSGQTLRMILREVVRDPSQTTVVSFPRQITSRAYLRDRDLLRQRDEADFFLFDDEEDEDDTETAAVESDDEESGDTDTDAETFAEDSVQVIDEDESTI